MTKDDLRKKVETMISDCFILERSLPNWRKNDGFLADTRYRLFLARVELGAILNFIVTNANRVDYRRSERLELRS